ncbi:conjugal transfer protein TraF [Agaribacterium sp. ZY112]|uniref:conjugal transfer protein TraF n=1 Tax=Agaribacterium sp. ZY112 TaxID=3233574 RepID=UPI0035247177
MSLLCRSLLCFGSLLLGTYSFAAGTGIFDARSLAMGGTTTASANLENAPFYNPALLSFHDKREEDSQSGRLFFPSIVLQESRALNDAINLHEQDLYDRVTSAVDAFNLDQNNNNAQTVLDLTREVQTETDKLGDQVYLAEALIGITLVQPSEHEGGAFYFNQRSISAGTADITDEDKQLLNNYIETLDFIISGGSQGAEHPELYIDGNPNNGLLDPRDNLSSNADLGSILVSEWGVSFAKQFPVFKQNVSFGFTPKLTRVSVFRNNFDFSDSSVELDYDEETFSSINLDLGIATEIKENFRLGLAIKDVFGKNYKSENDLEVKLRPQASLGAAYISNKYLIGIDLDLNESQALANEQATQYTSIGADITLVKDIWLRLGYRSDLNNTISDVASFGLAFKIKRFVMEGAYAHGDDVRGAAFQMGYAF